MKTGAEATLTGTQPLPPPPPLQSPVPPPPDDDSDPFAAIQPAQRGRKRKKKLKPAERRTKLRDRIWPGAEKEIWHRLENDGFITVPKLLSLVCALLKELADNDPTRVYLDLWCRSFDEGIIENIDEDDAAFSSGYVGTRAKRTWTEHMYQLQELGFIKIAPIGNCQIGHVLLRNPLVAVDELRSGAKRKYRVPDEWWNAYIARASVIGAALPSDDNDE